MAIFNSLFRLKKIDKNIRNTQLNRCLGLFHLTALGVGSTLGLGVYVVGFLFELSSSSLRAELLRSTIDAEENANHNNLPIHFL